MSLFSESNKEQLQAITHGDGPQLIVAGAGTGKTRVITARIAWLILEKNLNVDQLLALTFTEKASEEMEDRVLQMLPYGYVDLWISTFHSFCDKLLKRHALDIGLPNNYKLLDGTATWLLVRKNLEKFNLDYYRPASNPAKFIHALLRHFSRCKDEGIYPEDYLQYAEEIKLNNDATEFVKKLDLSGFSVGERKELMKSEIMRVEEIANAFHIYQRLLLENESLDFADLINYSIKLFRERPLILEKYRQQFKQILVDEFQDTNFVQYELIKMLAAPKNNITVVGDDDQSIYKFRGASITNIMKFMEDFPAADKVVLVENYRSHQEVLDTSYNFIRRNNPNRLEVKLGIDKKLKSISSGAEVSHLHCRTAEDEAETVVKKILNLAEEKKTSWSDFAILVRANDSANIFINCLEKAGIPYQFAAMRGLYCKPIVIDLINYLKLLDNYHESAAVFRILSLTHLKIDAEDIVKLVHYAKKKSMVLYDAMQMISAVQGINPENIQRVNKLLAQISKDSQLLKTKKPTEILMSFLYGSGYLEYLKQKDDRASHDDFNYLQQFFKKAQTMESNTPGARVSDLLDLIKMEQEAGETGQLAFDASVGPDMVRILTIHSAKGLEFDYVFIVNLVDRKFPTDERREPIEIPVALLKEKLPEGDFHLEEERRLFYVAMTRAKKGLYFTSAEDYGGARAKKLSRFLHELGYSAPEKAVKKDDGEIMVAPEVVLKKIKYELPKKFSFSQMQTYENCPLQYKFANILKIPTFGSPHFSFGTAIHSTLQKFLEEVLRNSNSIQPDLFGAPENSNQTELSLKRLFEIYDENWNDDWYEDKKQKEEYYEKGKLLLKNFYGNFMAEKPVVKNLEQIFHLHIGDYLFSGRIDRIDEMGDNAEIIDYKTGKTKDDKLSTEDRRQLLFYQIAAEEALKLNLEKLSYYYLEGDKKVSFIGKEKDKIKLKEKFLENIENIRAQKFDPNPNPFLCPYCAYKEICEFRK
ncbi:ATP-dependent helicase [Patescibacteria group bacterium]|nr:ATP-dependent helicase [Patescibacteria group bacterium]